MADKREPTLSDILITELGKPSQLEHTPQPPDLPKRLQHKIRMAEKFVFDRDASERVAIVLRDVPELIAENIQFARPPFDLCWIEYDSDVIFRMLNPDHYNPQDGTRDVKVGILIDHNRINVCSQTEEGALVIMPFAYHLNTEWPLEEQLQFCDQFKISRLGIDIWLWGSAGSKFLNEGNTQYLRTLRDTNMVECMFKNEELSYKHAATIIGSTTGDFKNHVAMLLMLNQPSVTQYIRVPSTRGWIRHKPRPFMKHTTIRMALDPVPKIRALSTNPGSGGLRRRHRVRGHYCHNKAARQAIWHHTCEHQWQPTNKRWELINVEVGDDVENWKCGKCEGKRWWKEEHRRGHYSEGEVEHTYEVTRHEKAPS